MDKLQKSHLLASKCPKKQTRISFVNSPTQLYSDTDKNELENYSTIPPLGLGYVATAAAEVVGRENVAFLDAEYHRLSPVEVAQWVKSECAEYIAINVTTPNYGIVKNIISEIRKITACKIILGGAHAVLTPDTILIDRDIRDLIYCVCVGDGEPMIIDLLQGKDLNDVANIMFLNDDSRIVDSKKRTSLKNLDLMIDRTFFKNGFIVVGNKKESYILTARGCPFRCSFCAAPTMNNKFRRRSDESIRKELHECINNGANYIRFVDDLFLTDEGRVLELKAIWDAVGLNRNNFGFEATARSNIVSKFSDETWSYLREMGLVEIEIGIESGSQRILGMMEKKTTNKEVITTVQTALKHGVCVKGFLMVGYPTEKTSDLTMTINLAKELKRMGGAHIRFSPVVVKSYPGTKIYEESLMQFDNSKSDMLIDVVDYLKDCLTDDQKNIVRKRTRYNAVHTLNGKPTSLSERTGGASLRSVLQTLVELILISENMSLQ